MWWEGRGRVECQWDTLISVGAEVSGAVRWSRFGESKHGGLTGMELSGWRRGEDARSNLNAYANQ